MTQWFHLSTILNVRFILRFAGILTLLVALITTLFFGIVAQAAPGINQTISFQGRLLGSNGEPVPNGNYNIQFKLYEGGTGAAVGNPGGTLRWTETYINNGGSSGIKVTNGYMSVNLGSINPFGSSVDWNQDTIWLSMNIAGLTTGCTAFNEGNCTADGEMTPMKRLTATPYALNAGKLGGIEASGFIQSGTALQNGNFNISGTGAANILRGTAGIEAPLLDRSDAGLLSIGTENATSIAIGSSGGESQLTLNGGTSGVQVDTAGGFTVRTDATDRDTLVIGSDGNTAINLSTETGFVINNAQDESVLKVGNDGTVETGENSHMAVKGTATFNQGIQIGDGQSSGEPKLLTLDSAAGAPAESTEAMLGSMYYDTTLGKVQCYEATGWGSCSSSPDSFVSLSPEFSNAVTNGGGIGTMKSDFCSDTLNINDGSGGQPTVCSTNETYNFYDWTSPEATGQTKSVFVTYQLPGTFKEFIEGSTSLMGRTDSTDANVSYEIYRNTSTGLVACGAPVATSTGTQTTWQTAVAENDNDPANCEFAAGDSIVFKVTFTAANDAHAYVSNLNFAFRTNN